MAIERKDIRLKVDDEVHTALKAICDLDGIDMGVFIEQLLVPAVEKRVHDAIALAERLQRAGIAGSQKRHPGAAGSRDK